MSVELQQIVAINLNLDLKTAYEIRLFYKLIQLNSLGI